MRYHHFVDESPERERRPHPEPLRDPHAGWRLCPECGGERFCQVSDGQGWRSEEQRCRMCSGTAECYFCGGGGEVREQSPQDRERMNREEFGRRLASIERRPGGGLGEAAPTRDALDAAYAELVELARSPPTRRTGYGAGRWLP